MTTKNINISKELMYFFIYSLKGSIFITIPILFISRGVSDTDSFYYVSCYALGYFTSSLFIIIYGSIRKGLGVNFNLAGIFSIISAIPLFALAFCEDSYDLYSALFSLGFICPFVRPLKAAKINYLTNISNTSKTRMAVNKYLIQNLGTLVSLSILYYFNEKIFFTVLAVAMATAGLVDFLSYNSKIPYTQIAGKLEYKKNINKIGLFWLFIILALISFVYDQTGQSFEVKLITSNYIHDVCIMWAVNIITIFLCFLVSWKVSFSSKKTPIFLALFVLSMSFFLFLGNYVENNKILLIIALSIAEYFVFAILDWLIIIASKGSPGHASFISSFSDLILYSSAAFLGVFQLIFNETINVSYVLNLCLIIGFLTAIIILTVYKNINSDKDG